MAIPSRLCYMRGRSGRLIATVVVAAALVGVVGVFLLAWLDNAQYIQRANVLRILLFVAPMGVVMILRFNLHWAGRGAAVSGVALVALFVVSAVVSGQFTEFEAMLLLVVCGAVISFLIRYRMLRWPDAPWD
jgi:ABC-type multidrug transport system permease subunit